MIHFVIIFGAKKVIFCHFKNNSLHDFYYSVKTNCSQLCCLGWNEKSNLIVFVNENSNYYIFDEYGKELSQYIEV
jgi:hypothetical protein